MFDMAVLLTSGTQDHTLALAAERPKPGERITQIGYGLTEEGTSGDLVYADNVIVPPSAATDVEAFRRIVVAGRIQTFFQAYFWAPIFRTSNALPVVLPGDSGGPLVKDGKLVGVASTMVWNETSPTPAEINAPGNYLGFYTDINWSDNQQFLKATLAMTDVADIAKYERDYVAARWSTYVPTEPRDRNDLGRILVSAIKECEPLVATEILRRYHKIGLSDETLALGANLLQERSEFTVLRQIGESLPAKSPRAEREQLLVAAYRGLEDWSAAAAQLTVILADPDLPVFEAIPLYVMRSEANFLSANHRQAAADAKLALATSRLRPSLGEAAERMATRILSMIADPAEWQRKKSYP